MILHYKYIFFRSFATPYHAHSSAVQSWCPSASFGLATALYQTTSYKRWLL